MIRTWKVKGRGLYEGNRVNSSEYFIKNDCVSCGWGKPAIEYPEYVKDFTSYKEKWLDMYDQGWHWGRQGVHHLFDSLQKGDFIWTRFNGEYYVAEISNDPKNLFSVELTKEAIAYDSVVQLKGLFWKKCGAEDSVPGSISTFSSNRNSLVRVDNKETTQNGYTASSFFSKKVLYPNYREKIKDRNMLLRFMGPSGLEDLVAMWLYDKFNYVVIPSTNKKSTQTYEFVLIDGTKNNGTYKTNKSIYIQVKNGEKDLYLKDYVELLDLDDEIWLITSRGKVFDLDNNNHRNAIVRYSKKNKKGKTDFFPLDMLLNFAFDKNKKAILPKSALLWTSLFE